MKELSILGRIIQIKMCSKRELQEFGSENLLGWFDSDSSTVYLYSGLESETSKRTLLHEVGHAMSDIGGLSEILKRKHEEAFCKLIENFLELFKNKKFVDYLNE